jgi:hypothetical protein
LRNYHLQQQNIYKSYLDNQIKDPLHHHRVRSLNYGDRNKMTYSYDSYMNNIPVNNPYNSHKNIYLGQTQIEHNPILNPIPNYRHNKYLYKDNSSLLKIVGSNLIN